MQVEVSINDVIESMDSRDCEEMAKFLSDNGYCRLISSNTVISSTDEEDFLNAYDNMWKLTLEEQRTLESLVKKLNP